MLDVKVNRDRTGPPRTRTIELGPGDALFRATGATQVDHRFATHTVVATVTCKCTKVERPRRPGQVFRFNAAGTGSVWEALDAERTGESGGQSDSDEDFIG